MLPFFQPIPMLVESICFYQEPTLVFQLVFLLSGLLMANSNKFITLESRLADLLYAEGDIYFDTGDVKHAMFPSVIAHTRNYYIHYDENIKNNYQIFSADELVIYKKVLFQILEYYIFFNFFCKKKKGF